MRSTRVALVFTLVLVGVAGLAAAAPTGPVQVAVDCNQPNASIADALEKKGDALVISISGLCSEDVLIRRDNVTLLGVTPDAGIASPSGSTATASIWVIDSQRVVLEALSIGPSARVGVQAFSSNVTINDCEIHDTSGDGVQSVGGGLVRLDSSTIRDAGRAGVSSWFGSDFSCTDSTIEYTSPTSPAGVGRWAGYAVGGRLVANASAATGGRFGFGAYDAGTAYIGDTDVHATQWAYLTDQNGQMWVNLFGANPVEFSGGVASEGGGILLLENATQLTGPTFGNVVYRGGLLHLTNDSSLIDPVYPELLGKVIVDGGSSITTSVECYLGGDLICQDANLITGPIYGCASCLVEAPAPVTSLSAAARLQSPSPRPRPDFEP